MNAKHIVIVDDDEKVLRTISHLLEVETEHKVHTFASPRDAIAFLKENSADVIVSDYLMAEMDGLAFLSRAREFHAEVPRIIITGYADKKNAIRAINEVGLFYYVEKPWNNDDLLLIIRNALEHRDLTESLKKALTEVELLKDRLRAENIYLREEIKSENNFEEIVTAADAFRRTLRKVEQVAPTGAAVLITGESGTGKELIARAVHNLSPRHERPLIKVNCAALPAGLIESELLGHEKGAFTGATARKTGRFELADRGTIFLDEIGDLPLELQVKLLRILQEGEFERLGGAKTIAVDVRVISATNRNLERAVEMGTFREDLFYRLNVFPVHCPPLRERLEDIPLLVQHFVRKDSARTGKSIEEIPRKVIESLQKYHWPGNVRELKNVIERAMIISTGSSLDLGDWCHQEKKTAYETSRIGTLEEIEKNHIERAMELTGGRISGPNGAAQMLGINSSTLISRMKKLGIK